VCVWGWWQVPRRGEGPLLICTVLHTTILQDRGHELREELRWHEAQQLNSTIFAAADAKQGRRRPTTCSAA
jgi:hypothetical protein